MARKNKDGKEVVNYARKYRIHPTEEQAVLIRKTFGCVRCVWNLMLADSQANEKHTIPSPAKYKEDRHWLKEVDSLALNATWKDLCQAYKNHFSNAKHFGKPNFKSKKKCHCSYTTNVVNDNIRFSDDMKYLRLPKLKDVRVKVHYLPKKDSLLKAVTISQEPDGKFYASVLFECENQTIEKNEMTSSVGLDFSPKSLYVDSNGHSPADSRFYRHYERKLKIESRRLSKLFVKGAKSQSSNYYKQLRKVAKLHVKVANCRKDFLHKESRKLIDSYDIIAIEDLNMHAMARCLRLGKSIHDIGWGMFSTFLQYKALDQGKILIKIDKWFPSSQTCHVCGVKSSVTKDLKVRKWTCPHCGSKHNRDHNAAINIKNEGLRMVLNP